MKTVSPFSLGCSSSSSLVLQSGMIPTRDEFYTSVIDIKENLLNNGLSKISADNLEKLFHYFEVEYPKICDEELLRGTNDRVIPPPVFTRRSHSRPLLLLETNPTTIAALTIASFFSFSVSFLSPMYIDCPLSSNSPFSKISTVDFAIHPYIYIYIYIYTYLYILFTEVLLFQRLARERRDLRL